MTVWLLNQRIHACARTLYKVAVPQSMSKKIVTADFVLETNRCTKFVTLALTVIHDPNSNPMNDVLSWQSVF